MVSSSNIVSHSRGGGGPVPDADGLVKEFAGAVSQDKVRSCVMRFGRGSGGDGGGGGASVGAGGGVGSGFVGVNPWFK